MARVRWNTATLPKYVSSMWSNTEAWQDIRTSPQLMSYFASMGDEWVGDLNDELHTAQAARKQKIEDGYKYAISMDNDRIRMRIWAFTARAMVHEAKHQSILKLMRTVGTGSGFDFNRRSRGKQRSAWDFGGKKRKRKPSGNRRSGATGGTSGPRSGSGMDPRRAETYRRQLRTLDILSERGSTEGERNNAAEKARRIRERLGE